MTATAHPPPPVQAAPPFGVNEVRLKARHWLIALLIVVASALAAPRIWMRFEHFQPGPDYRIPYALSQDYWLYQRRLDLTNPSDTIIILGDSVVWGEYVRLDGTLSHFLNQQAAASDRFINGGVNGLFPLAMEGLVNSYGSALKHRKIIVQCNMLWMSSPRADLSAPAEQKFNHSRLVPQFTPRIPAYQAKADERFSAVIENHVEFLQWVNHLQAAYYGQRSMPQWTLEETGGDPPRYPNAWRNPLSPLRQGIPVEPANDPLRGPASRRHRPWNSDGAEPSHFEWVPLQSSLQWRAFQRLIDLLRTRGNDVLVIVGPLNEHMIAPDQLPRYRAMRAGIVDWLQSQKIATLAPTVLPTDLYADMSHPLTQGYQRLAGEIWQNRTFQSWLNAGR